MSGYIYLFGVIPLMVLGVAGLIWLVGNRA